jgi:hypothetical protein
MEVGRGAEVQGPSFPTLTKDIRENEALGEKSLLSHMVPDLGGPGCTLTTKVNASGMSQTLLQPKIDQFCVITRWDGC